jgi:nucleoside-diphosphate-sugar epimerase
MAMSVAQLGRAVVSGATGFVGRSLVSLLEGAVAQVHLGEADWADQVRTADYAGATVFHLAAKVHGQGPDTRDAYWHDNVVKTRSLAQAAASGGARRFVFLSSVKVNGEETSGHPFRSTDKPAPEDDYGKTKWEAEKSLAQFPGMEFAVVRSPLVYGAGVKGNLLALLHLADSGVPLPFGGIENRRSFIHVDDLARLLIECGASAHAPGRVFMAAHPDRVSTPRLIAAMRMFLGRPRRLAPVPRVLLEGLALASGQRMKMRRLTRSLEVDAAETQQALGWIAQISFETGMEDMVRTYRESLG